MECSSCQKPLSSSVKGRILPICRHVMCEECLELEMYNRRIRCPIDRKVTVIREGLAGLEVVNIPEEAIPEDSDADVSDEFCESEEECSDEEVDQESEHSETPPTRRHDEYDGPYWFEDDADDMLYQAALEDEGSFYKEFDGF